MQELVKREYDDDEQESARKKKEVFAFASRSNAQGKPKNQLIFIFKNCTYFSKKTLTDTEQGAQFDQAHPMSKRLHTLFDTENCLEKKRRPNFGDSTFVWWCLDKQDDKTRKQQKNISILYCQDKKFFTSDLFHVIQDAIPLTLTP